MFVDVPECMRRVARWPLRQTVSQSWEDGESKRKGSGRKRKWTDKENRTEEKVGYGLNFFLKTGRLHR